MKTHYAMGRLLRGDNRVSPLLIASAGLPRAAYGIKS